MSGEGLRLEEKWGDLLSATLEDKLRKRNGRGDHRKGANRGKYDRPPALQQGPSGREVVGEK